MGRKKNNDKKALIWRTAYDLFLEKGYKNVTINEIAQTSGVSNNLVPHYFKKSDDFLVDIMEYVFRECEDFLWNIIDENEECMDFIRSNTECTRTLVHCASWLMMLENFLKDDEKLLNLYGEVFFNMELFVKTIRRLFKDKGKRMIWLYQQKLITPISNPENGETFLWCAFLSVWTIHYRNIASENYRSTLDYMQEIVLETLKTFCKALDIPKEKRVVIWNLSNAVSTQKARAAYAEYYEESIDAYLNRE